MKLILPKDSTSVSVDVFVPNSSLSTGAGLTGLVYNSPSLTAYYHRPGGSTTAITLATLAAYTSAYSSGGFKEIDATNMPGWYRLDIPDAVLATGVNFAYIALKGAANMAPVNIEIQLSSMDLNDAVRGGMTALPNAAAAASGGLPILGTNATAINFTAGMTVSSTTGTALTLSSSGGNGHGLAMSGNGSGSGSSSVGGATGPGARFVGGSSSGAAVTMTNTTGDVWIITGVAGNANCLKLVPQGSGFGINGSISGAITGDITGNLSGSVGSVTGAVGSVTGNVGGNVVGSVASVTGNVGGNVTGSVGSVVGAVGSVTGNVGGSVASVVGAVGSVTGNVGGSVASVVGAVGSVTGNVGGNVTGSVGSVVGSVGSVVGAVGSVTGNVGGDVVGSVASVTAAVTVGTISANVVTASALATDAVDEIAAAVWDLDMTGHTTSGTFGEAMSDAGSAGDPWTTALPGAYTAGQAGYILGTNLDDTVTSRASAADLSTLDGKVDTVDTVVDSIQTDTNDIQTRLPAALVGGRMDASVGAMAANVLTAAATHSDFGSEIAAAVWDLDMTGHTTAGTFGEAMSAAGTAGDPWNTSLPGAYVAGKAGYIVGRLANSAELSQSIVVGTVAGSSSTVSEVVGDSGLSDTNDIYNNMILQFTSGVNAGLNRRVSDYDGATRTFSFTGTGSADDRAWNTEPAEDDTFTVLGRIRR